MPEDLPYGMNIAGTSVVFYFTDGTEVWDASGVALEGRVVDVYALVRSDGVQVGGTRT